jgi:CubicO group peptidase (beta-lactamase class C family)
MSLVADAPYFPPPARTAWERIDPEAAGFDAARLDEAMRLAQSRETPWPRDLRRHLESGFFDTPPFNEIIGPTAARGAPNGLLLRGGRIVASFGDTLAVDMTFSVAKSYLSLLAGIAVADGLITDLDEPVGRSVMDGGFDSEHNRVITWRHLLQLTSEWEGTLFGKPDQVDRNRVLGVEGRGATKGQARPLREPGSYWEYNDVRVNRLSLALLRRFERALPDVFAERIMGPIGASSDWRWEGYRNSFVEIGGQQVQSVPGGGHWGGGVFIHAQDQARVALLMLRGGLWDGRRVLPADWIAASVEPCDVNPLYGLMWWLNTGRQKYPAASEQSFFALGAGGNLCWIDPTTDIVVVLRWVAPDAVNGFIAAVTAALRRRDE